MLEHRADLIARYTREPLKKVVNLSIILKVLEERRDRHA